MLGDGYLAQYLEAFIEASPHSDVKLLVSSRNKPKRIHFELEKPETWENIWRACESQQIDCAVWTFPAPNSPKLLQAFYKTFRQYAEKLIVMGSTSSFEVKELHEWVTELSPLDLDKARVRAEEYLRELGATVLCSAGFYSSSRHPIMRLYEGRATVSDRFINLIHMDDLCQFILNLAAAYEPAKRFIAADGCPVNWRDILAHADAAMFSPQHPAPGGSDQSRRQRASISKRVDASWSASTLNIAYRFPSYLAFFKLLKA